MRTLLTLFAMLAITITIVSTPIQAEDDVLPPCENLLAAYDVDRADCTPHVTSAVLVLDFSKMEQLR